MLVAPYHRPDKSIIEMQAILNGPEATARGTLAAVGASYVVLCPGFPVNKYAAPSAPDALKPALLAGRVPDFLEPVALAEKTPLKVWRVR